MERLTPMKMEQDGMAYIMFLSMLLLLLLVMVVVVLASALLLLCHVIER